MKIGNFTAFTLVEEKKVNVLKTKVKISADKNINPNFLNKREEFVAIWDTGATGSVISQKLANELNLTPVGKTKVSTAGGVCESNQYIINLRLPNRLSIEGALVTTGNLGDDVDFLVGMDIITLGDFAVTNVGGQMIFSFRFPSCETIDFVSQARELKKKQLEENLKKQEQLIKKSGKCSCGSGKLFRYCCGKKQMQELKKELELIGS